MDIEDVNAPKIIFDAEHICDDLKIFNELGDYMVENIDKYKITYISMEDGVIYINFIADESKSSLRLNNIAKFSIGNIDYNNLYKITFSFTSTAADIYSRKLGKRMFEVMIWDTYNKIMPTCRVVAEKLIIEGNRDMTIKLNKGM